MQLQKQTNRIGNSPAFWIVAFMICIAPLALTYMLHYIDELHYTDAAIRMVQSHDFFTPLQANGEPRFLKPVFTYWMVAGSYELFGISQFSSRLPFLIFGMLLLFITYRIAFKLTKNRDISLMALLIAASNPLLILSSSRSIPDLPQALFFATGALGLAGIFVSDQPRNKDLWLFYLGFALAFATKGIPAAVFMFLSVLFLLFNPWKRISLKSLINWPAIIIGLIVGLWWYILMYILYGDPFIASFFTDQVSGRVSENHFRILKNAAFALLTIAGYFIFWIAPISNLKIKTFLRSPEIPLHYRMFAAITGIWLIAMFVFSVFTVKFYDRYFLPVFPLISVLIAVLSVSIANRTAERGLCATNIILQIAGIIVSLISVVIAVRLENTATCIVSALLVILFGLKIILSGKGSSLLSGSKAVSGSILLTMLSASMLIGNFALPDQSTQIAVYLEKHKPESQTIVFYGLEKVAAKIRVATHGAVAIKCIEPQIPPVVLSGTQVIFREDTPPGFISENYTISTISSEWKSFPIVPLLFTSDAEKVKRDHLVRHKIITIR